METRVAVMSIIVENPDSVEALNALLHTFSEYVIGRMGIPYRDKNIKLISVAVDAPQNEISALSGKIGKLSGVSIKTAYSGVISSE
ncbi:MAG: iron-only hydrogenase system regulator [Ruminococcus sp.]|nr:iron-only hydrogenase system regulator [Ruminococcus sp.]